MEFFNKLQDYFSEELFTVVKQNLDLILAKYKTNGKIELLSTDAIQLTDFYEILEDRLFYSFNNTLYLITDLDMKDDLTCLLSHPPNLGEPTVFYAITFTIDIHQREYLLICLFPSTRSAAVTQ